MRGKLAKYLRKIARKESNGNNLLYKIFYKKLKRNVKLLREKGDERNEV